MKAKLDHVALAVRNIEEATAVYEQFGLEAAETCTMEESGLRIGFLSAGGSQLELLEPLRPDNTVARFLERRGEGLHHICFEVEDIRAALAELSARGVELIDREPRPGAEGLTAFLHPRAGKGVLIELVQKEHPGP
jgi:methylmalonyl-CoA epimerase